VAAASAVLADLEKGGILKVLLGGDDERRYPRSNVPSL
jgi:hypothetical protein